jgi:sec-independent protein translocase protein TatB
MLGIGFWEMLVICGLILVAVGPDRLPAMVKTVAKFYRQFRRTAEDLRASTGIDDLLRDEELKELAELRKQKLQLLQSQAAKPIAKPPVATPAAPVAPSTASAPAGSPTLPATRATDDPGHALLGHAIPRTRSLPRGPLDDKERAIEVPPEGVDLVEARRHEPVLSEDEIALRKQRIAAKLAGKSLEEIAAAEAPAARPTPGAV